MRTDTHRRAVTVRHRARPGQTERTEIMESYRNQIITMLDTIQDAAVMRLIYNVVKAIMMSR